MYQLILYVSVIVFNTGISTTVVERGTWVDLDLCKSFMATTIVNEEYELNNNQVPPNTRVDYSVTGRCVLITDKE